MDQVQNLPVPKMKRVRIRGLNLVQQTGLYWERPHALATYWSRINTEVCQSVIRCQAC